METNEPSQTGSPEAAAELLGSLIGVWEGTNNTWFEPDVLADAAAIRGTIRQLPGASTIIYEYESTMEDQAFHGVAIFGFNVYTCAFEMAWSDSFHMSTNVMFASGGVIDGGFSVLGSFRDPNGGPDWGWRTEVVLHGTDELTITAYNIAPDGQESVGVQAVMTRAGM